MARFPVIARVYAVVFLGACVGGATRLGIDEALGTGSWSWDIVAINLVGSALLGALMGWFSSHQPPWWVPGIGTGVLGGFTTFSSMAALHHDAPLPGAVLLIGTLIGASAAAAIGWRAADAMALRIGAVERTVEPEQIESEVEGFDGFDELDTEAEVDR